MQCLCLDEELLVENVNNGQRAEAKLLQKVKDGCWVAYQLPTQSWEVSFYNFSLKRMGPNATYLKLINKPKTFVFDK